MAGLKKPPATLDAFLGRNAAPAQRVSATDRFLAAVIPALVAHRDPVDPSRKPGEGSDSTFYESALSIVWPLAIEHLRDDRRVLVMLGLNRLVSAAVRWVLELYKTMALTRFGNAEMCTRAADRESVLALVEDVAVQASVRHRTAFTRGRSDPICDALHSISADLKLPEKLHADLVELACGVLRKHAPEATACPRLVPYCSHLASDEVLAKGLAHPPSREFYHTCAEGANIAPFHATVQLPEPPDIILSMRIREEAEKLHRCLYAPHNLDREGRPAESAIEAARNNVTRLVGSHSLIQRPEFALLRTANAFSVAALLPGTERMCFCGEAASLSVLTSFGTTESSEARVCMHHALLAYALRLLFALPELALRGSVRSVDEVRRALLIASISPEL